MIVYFLSNCSILRGKILKLNTRTHSVVLNQIGHPFQSSIVLESAFFEMKTRKVSSSMIERLGFG